MEKTNEILLVEDRENVRDKITSSIKSVEASQVVHTITSENVDDFTISDSKSLELCIAECLREDFRNVGLIIVDHDLSQLGSGLSESAITAAAHSLAIPICRYHRRVGNRSMLEHLWELNSRVYAIDYIGQFDFEEDEPKFPRFVLNILKGFNEIASRLSGLPSEVKKLGVAAAMATILDRPELEDYFSAYAIGVSFLNDILIIQKALREHNISSDPDAPEEQVNKRTAYILGYWLYNFVLQFPGVLLNDTATASYVDIEPGEFNTNESIRDCLSEAKYDGPFSSYDNYWWRPVIDDLLIENGNRNELLASCGLDAHAIARCKCSVSDSPPAGYYDLSSGEPISKEYSIGGLSWVPPGADLTRINKERYDELEPILG